MKRWLYWRVVRLNDLTNGRYWRLQSKLWVAGWSD
jgi:hypothetical protein